MTSSGISTEAGSKFVTLLNTNMLYTTVVNRAAPPAIFELQGTQNLHLNSTIKGMFPLLEPRGLRFFARSHHCPVWGLLPFTSHD